MEQDTFIPHPSDKVANLKGGGGGMYEAMTNGDARKMDLES